MAMLYTYIPIYYTMIHDKNLWKREMGQGGEKVKERLG